MLKSRNFLAMGIVVVMMLAVMTSWASAQPVRQDTPTPEATAIATDTPVATETIAVTETTSLTDTPAPTETAMPTATSAAPTVSPIATPAATAISTPSTLPKTGGDNTGTATLGLLVFVVGALLILGGFSLALARRTH